MHMLTNIHHASIVFNVKTHIRFWTKMSILASIPTQNVGQTSALEGLYKGI